MIDAGASDDSGESRKERADRELIEMLNELRVGLPGVQVLFAFLLTVPFSQNFAAPCTTCRWSRRPWPPACSSPPQRSTGSCSAQHD